MKILPLFITCFLLFSCKGSDNTDSDAAESSTPSLPLNLTGNVTTFAGTGTLGQGNGALNIATFNFPMGIDVDSSGNIWIFDNGGSLLRKLSSDGTVSTVAGTYTVFNFSDGTGGSARFNSATDIAVCADDNIYVADNSNHVIRKVTPAGEVTTFAGVSGSRGSDDGVGPAATFDYPSGITCDTSGNLFVVGGDDIVRKITVPGAVVTTYAGTANANAHADGPKLSASFNDPKGIAIDKSGNIYIADSNNYVIRKISKNGIVSTMAGSVGVNANIDGTGTDARFGWIDGGIDVDDAGYLYVADSSNNTIRRITPLGEVTTIAGIGPSINGFVDGVGTAAQFYWPSGLRILNGNLYITDGNNNSVRKIE